MQVLFLMLLAIVVFIVCIVLIKAEEKDGLNSFGRKIIGSMHGDLISVTPLENHDPPRPALVFARALLVSALALIIIASFIIFYSSSLRRGLNDSISFIFPIVVTSTAFSAYRTRGFFSSLLGAVLGFIAFGLLVITITVWISIEMGSSLVDQFTLNGLHALFGSFGAALGVAAMPAQCRFKRVFADGYTDTIWVSQRSTAYRAFHTITCGTQETSDDLGQG